MSGAPTFGDAVLRIAPDQILIPERLGLWFPDKATALGRMMLVSGQHTPITVRKSGPRAALPWTLVVGRHRLGGALSEDLPELMALHLINATPEQIKEIEASENLDRRKQPPLEEAIFIHATVHAAKERLAREHGDLNAKQLAAKARWERAKDRGDSPEPTLQEASDDAADKMSAAYNWQDSVAAAFQRDKRSIRRALKLHLLIIEPFPDLVQALSDHRVVGENAKQLADIADVRNEAQRRQVIEALLAYPTMSAEMAIVHVGLKRESFGATPLPHQRFFNQIEGGWSRLDLKRQREFLPRLIAMLGTPDLKRTMRDRLNEELGDV